MKKDLLTKMLMIGGAGFGSLIVTIAIIWAMSGEPASNSQKGSQDHSIPQEMTGDNSSSVLDSLDGAFCSLGTDSADRGRRFAGL